MAEPLLDEEDFADAVAERGPIWRVRVTLAVMREGGASFATAWHSAMQRLRVQPTMDPEDVDELIAAKAWMEWAKQEWEAAYNREPRVQMMDGQVFTPAEIANLARTERGEGKQRRTQATPRAD